MEIQVSDYTLERVETKYNKNDFITKRDVPDLDCVYVGNHLRNQLYDMGEEAIHYNSVRVREVDNCGVLYNGSSLNTSLVANRLKKMKY